MDRGAWWAAAQGVAKSRTRLSNFTFTFHFHALEKAMAPHSSVLAWRIPGTGEPGGLPSLGSHRVGHACSDAAAAAPCAVISLNYAQWSLLFVNPWTIAHQAPLSMGFSRQVPWSGVPFPSPGDLPDPGMEPLSPAARAVAGGFCTAAPPGRPPGFAQV